MFCSCCFLLRFIKEKDVCDQKCAAGADADVRDIKYRPDVKVKHICHVAQRHAVNQIAKTACNDELHRKTKRKMRILMPFHIPNRDQKRRKRHNGQKNTASGEETESSAAILHIGNRKDAIDDRKRFSDIHVLANKQLDQLVENDQSEAP